jgi:Meiotically up-regulated gene 113
VRDQILNEIRRLAVANGGKPPGSRLFEAQSGIREAAWRGVYWARWGDAVAEAGLQPNARQGRLDDQFYLTKFAEACRHFSKVPTAMELRMYQKSDADFPNVKTITRRFGSLNNVPEQLAEWVKSNDEYRDVAAMLMKRVARPQPEALSSTKEGLVYLIRSGPHYKIGRSEELERRVKEIRVALPEAATLVHSIRTDDPAGIEAYWHRRFADQRANGEWFKLSSADVAAFKRRKFQ